MASSDNETRARAGRLRLIPAANNDSFPADLRSAIDKAAAAQKLNSWHLELAIDDAQMGDDGVDPEKGRVRFKHNFPDGMREFIKQNLGLDDWCLEVTLRDGDGEDGTGDDDGTAPGFDSKTLLKSERKTRKAPSAAGRGTKAAKSAAARSPTKSVRSRKTTAAKSRPPAKNARSTARKRSRR